jgi:hypothetical protein
MRLMDLPAGVPRPPKPPPKSFIAQSWSAHSTSISARVTQKGRDPG